jgi:hypothetical protein
MVVPCERMFLSRALALDELEATMWELENDKSPSSNGLLVEFYKKIW